jgi:UDP-glucose 4-epimerase
MKKALITGGSGYLGSVLSKHLEKEGWHITLIDIKPPEHNYFDDWYNVDITDYRKLDEFFQRSESYGIVYHLAGRIEVGLSTKESTEFWKVNTGGTINVIDCMKKYGVKRIVYSSTAGVYLDGLRPIPEDECTTNNHVYGNTKKAAEDAIIDSGLSFVIFRYFNLAGADADVGENHHPETHLIPSILQNLNNFQVYGNDYNTPDGSCVRDYVHVSDVADAHIAAYEYLSNGGMSDIFNLGTGKGHSIFEIINIIGEELGITVNYTVVPRRPGDPDALVADITYAKEVLNYRPKHDIISILKTAYEWNKANYEK